MPRREMISLVAGLIVGLIIGMVLIGSSDSLRDSMFGTASNSDKESDASTRDLQYYLVELPAAQEWLVEKYPELSDSTDLNDAVDLIARLPTAEDFPHNVVDAEEAVNVVLPNVYQALEGAEELQPAAEVKVEDDNEVMACLGMDDDPYSMTGPILYFYLAVPGSQAKSAGIPKEWKIEQPKTNDLYWQLLSCFPALEPDK